MTNWQGCYKDNWKNVIVPEAFCHPAKFSRGLIRRIYQHAFEESWLHEGDTVADPFGGVALGGLDAMLNGINWVGCELEEKFVGLGNKNIELWNTRYAGKMPRWGTARLLQGDSRNFAEIVRGAMCAISSPPYQETPVPETLTKRYGDNPDITLTNQRSIGYGSTPGNLGNLPSGDVNMVLSSPPYAESLQPETEDQTQRKQERIARSKSIYDGRKIEKNSPGKSALGGGYGQTPGQLGSLPAGEVGAVISSPPFENSLSQDDRSRDQLSIVDKLEQKYKRKYTSRSFQNGWNQVDPSNIGNATGDTFWSASRTIVEQVYQVLPIGKHAIWVCKRYVKNKQIVEFSQNWAMLCENVGFKTVCWHRAWLVEDRGTSITLEGEHINHKTERKSFFRRLAENKGSPRIDWEDVICMVKQ